MGRTHRLPRAGLGTLALLLVALATALSAGAITVAAVPQPPAGKTVVDLLGLLPAPVVAELEALGERVKSERGAELCVVVIGRAEPPPGAAFARALFDRWQLGGNRWLNGLLVLVAHEDGEVHLALGEGITTDAMMRRTQAVIDEVMLPRFRADDPAGAILAGSRAAAERILGLAPQPLAAARLPAAPPTAASPRPRGPVAGSSAGTDRAVGVLALSCLGSLLFFLALVLAIVFVLRRRRRPPRCRRCGQAMELLSEAVEDLHLTTAEMDEEKEGSVQHEVWACRRCGEVEKRQRRNLKSAHTACPRCGARTRLAVTSLLREPTREEAGRVRIEELCAHCGYAASSERDTPKLVVTRHLQRERRRRP